MKVIDNKNLYMIDVLKRNIDWADDFYLAVAFGSYQAFERLRGNIDNFLKRTGKIKAVFDLKRRFTDPKLIDELSTIPGDCLCKIFYPTSKNSGSHPYWEGYHPKLYIFKKDKDLRIITGSSNFTVSGLEKNCELNFELETTENERISKDFLGAFNGIWVDKYSLSTEMYWDELSKNYALLKKLEDTSRKKPTKNITRIQDEIESQVEGFVEESLKGTPQIAYILGLLCGKGTVDIKKREAKIQVTGGVLNSTDPKNKGFVYAENISEVRISQDEAYKKNSNDIVESLNELFFKSGSKDLAACKKKGEKNYEVKICFHRSSSFWMKISELTKSLINKKEDLHSWKDNPCIPEFISSGDVSQKKWFVRGYLDLRSRLSKGDAYPTGKLRVGVGLSTDAMAFGEELKSILNNEFNMGAKIESGKKRGRDHIIRIDPVSMKAGFHSFQVKELLLRDFKAYNKNNF
jgi:HKD family nuclease